MKYLLALALVLLPFRTGFTREPEGIYPEIRGTFDPVALAPVLEKGTVVIIHEEPGKPTFLTGILLIHASFEKVWSVVTDYERYHEFVPNVIRNTVIQRHPETRTQDTEYKTGFKAGPIELGIVWTLEQHLEKDEHTIWAGPSKIGEQAFSAVNYREIYFPVDENRTIMTYTNYADLASFGALAKLVFKAFPELETPTLVSVGTLFPESIKERVEGSRIIVEPKEFDRDRVAVPPPIENSGVLDGLIHRFRKLVLSWYPDSNGIRFFSALALVDAPPEQCKAVVSDFASYPRIFKTVESTRKVKGTNEQFTMEYRTKYKVALPLTFEYSLDYRWEPGGKRLSFALNRIRDHTIEGEWGAWDFYPTNGDAGASSGLPSSSPDDAEAPTHFHSSPPQWNGGGQSAGQKTLVGYTSFTDLRSGGFFLRVLMDNIAGFGTGFRVGLNSMVMQALTSAMARPHVSNVSEVGF